MQHVRENAKYVYGEHDPRNVCDFKIQKVKQK